MHHVKPYGNSPFTSNWVHLNDLEDIWAGEVVSPIRGHAPFTYDRLRQEINCAMILNETPDKFGRYLVMDGGLLRYKTCAIIPIAGTYTVGTEAVLAEYFPTGGTKRYLFAGKGTAVAGDITWVDGATIGVITDVEYEVGTDIPKTVDFLIKFRR